MKLSRDPNSPFSHVAKEDLVTSYELGNTTAEETLIALLAEFIQNPDSLMKFFHLYSMITDSIIQQMGLELSIADGASKTFMAEASKFLNIKLHAHSCGCEYHSKVKTDPDFSAQFRPEGENK